MANNKKRGSEKTPYQSKTFTLELYPEWEQIATILQYIQTNYNYAWIVHDKDTYDDPDKDNFGNLKKKHIHAFIECGGRRVKTSVQKEFAIIGVESRFVDTCNKRAMLRYLTHKDNPEKYQYDVNDIQTNIKDDIENAYADEMTSDKAFYVLNQWIKKQSGIVNQSAVNDYAYENNLLGGLRKFGSQINNARIEHNRQYDEDRVLEGRAEVKAIEIARSRDNKTKEMFQLLDKFGVIKTTMPNEKGVMIPVTIALRKPENEPENEPERHQEAIWEGLPRKE